MAVEVKRIPKELQEAQKKEQATAEAQLKELTQEMSIGLHQQDDVQELVSVLADLDKALSTDGMAAAERRGLLTYVTLSITPREAEGEIGVSITLKLPMPGKPLVLGHKAGKMDQKNK